MKVRWKKNDRLKPQVLIDKLREITTVSGDGRVGYSAFEKHEVDSVILTMLDFDGNYSHSTIRKIFYEAQGTFAKGEVFTKDSFLQELNAAFVRHGRQKEKIYVMVTSISLLGGFPIKLISSGNAIIKTHSSGLPKKFSTRGKHKWNNELEASPKSYCSITVTLKSKDRMDAFHAAIHELDYVRGVFSLLTNPVSEFNFGTPKIGSLNRIILGGLHSLHHNDGELVDENLYWHERNYRVIKPTNIKSRDAMAKIARTIFRKVGLHGSASVIKSAIVRYVRAFDEHDKNIVILKLWAALESMVSPFENNAESIVRRCSFMFADRPYYAQILEHLREYRNRNVHTGQEIDILDYHCYQLQVFFKEAVLFYISNYKIFPTLAIANKFLDLPSGFDELMHLKRSVNKALRYQRHYDDE